MSKTIFALLGLIFMIGLISSSQSQASEQNSPKRSDKVYLSYCSNFGDRLSTGFKSCVNRNFRTIARELGSQVYISRCSNFGGGVSYNYESCVNRNFSSIERELRGTFLSRCSNFSRDRVEYSFLSCINSNFSSIERDMRRRR